jgi:hypothetical protein
LVLARALGNGKLIRFDLGMFKSTIELVSSGSVAMPFVLPNGALACVADGELHLIGDESRRVVKFPGSEKPLLVISSRNRESRWTTGARLLDLLDGVFRYSEAERFWSLDLPEGLKFEPVAVGGGVSKKLGPQRRIIDWDPATQTFVVSGGNFEHFYERVSESNGEPFGIGWSGGGKNVYDGINYSNTSSGWRALSFVTGASTGGFHPALLSKMPPMEATRSMSRMVCPSTRIHWL